MPVDGRGRNMAVDHKVAFVTGANRGIGLATAEELGELGITVILGARDYGKGLVAAQNLRDVGIDAHAIECDVTNSEHHRRVFRFLEEHFGKLDILVNNAAVQLDPASPDQQHPNTTSSTPIELLRKTIETNFFSVVGLTQTLLPLIHKSSSGRIVNVTSLLGSLTLLADPESPVAPYRYFAYGTSKTALNAFTLYLADELRGSNIKVNAAEPGWVKTEMGGSLAELDARDGAKTSAWLATVTDDGPTGGYFHLKNTIPW